MRKPVEKQHTRSHVKLETLQSNEKLLSELERHMIELEMQNDALRKSQLALEVSRDRYFNLYEYAIVSFVTLSQAGQIAEINLTGAALLGTDRKKLLQRRFDRYVLPEYKKQWQLFFINALKSDMQHSIELQMRKFDGTEFYAYLISQPIMLEVSVTGLHITLIDNTEQKLKEAEKLHFKSLISLLTHREREVLALAMSCMPNSEISEQLNITVRTVETFRLKIHKKTKVESMLKFVRMAANAGVSPAEIKSM